MPFLERSESGRSEPGSLKRSGEEIVSPCKRVPAAPEPGGPQQLWRWTSGSSVEEVWSAPPRHRDTEEWGRGDWKGRGKAGKSGKSISGQDRADIQQWRECTCVGAVVPGTSIIPCKTPFEGPLAESALSHGFIEEAEGFTKKDLIAQCADRGTPVGLVIDLVNTLKYYTGFTEEDGIEYRKVKIPGRQVPPRHVIEEVLDMVDDFVNRRPTEYVAIHCTHGVNRTGFIVCVYLMTRAHLPTRVKAVEAFEKARGTKMDKEYLIEALDRLEQGDY